ncbi:hypothetical protein HPG69_008727 [Diceros bicornis minor]|uniref:Uncharacterized protein n=1 Tax=Diceros bicornis minor TaxID=77932 RepID=A0A7J7FAN5_DICBM|nr:hypothetical protein HPG69_008727 [Diceros bicornis minor]
MSISAEFWKKYVIVGTLKSKNHLLFYFFPRNEMHFLSIIAHSTNIWVGLYKVLNKLFAKVSIRKEAFEKMPPENFQNMLFLIPSRHKDGVCQLVPQSTLLLLQIPDSALTTFAQESKCI